ncbi:MAG: energy-coupling factor transporter ATPase [Desulfobacterota bacterium]|nr:energy-coupling factor transporter ATPase [Thermodesulfobacteriota bacterium]MDW8001166.1 energy-coupling factor transporter ATPase [Deltaproteobacteria bacterium]
MDPTIAFEELSFRYANSYDFALKNISGIIDNGTFLTVMGRTGAGKSTLCYSLNGLVPHFFKGDYHGKVRVSGEEVKKSKVYEMARKVGLVFQDFETQLFSSNAELEVAFGLENLGLPREEIEKRIDKYLKFVDLIDLKKRDISTLSGGQKQRLAIASVLSMEQPVLVLDEPLTDLDPEGRRRILEIREKLKRQSGIVIMVDNDPENSFDSDEIWILKDAEIFARGNPKEILKRIELLEACGIMVPKHFYFFTEMGLKDIPFTFEDSMRILEKEGYLTRRKTFNLSSIKSDEPKEGIIEFRDVSYFYLDSQIMALRNINLTIKEGEFVAIVGSNGSGKTTLAKHANGLLIPSKGQVLVNKKDTVKLNRKELARQVGYVFQNPDHQISCRTVFDEVSFGLLMLGFEKKEIKRNVEEALWATGLEGYEDRSPFLLSKGERQRVACASVLATKPQVLILDEPTTGLDYEHQLRMMEMLKELRKKGHTIVIITHSVWVVENYADRCIVMKDGEIIKDDVTRKVFFDEDKLKEAGVYPSILTRIANRLGTESLEPKKMIEELKDESFSLPGERYSNP